MNKRNIYLKYLCVIILIITIFPTLSIYASADSGEKQFSQSISAKAAVLYEPTTGRFLYQKNSKQKLPMASTTKIMTAIVVMHECNITDTVTIGPESTGIEGSSAYLKEGDEYSVLELLYALLLQSANDAATALAYYTAGGIEEFADLMNQKSSALGVQNTHFTNPHGLHDEEHYTTAEDLAKIGAALLSDNILKEIVSTYKKNFTHEERRRTYINHNKLLQNYSGSIGIKTGFTKKSGRCLVSAAERDGLTLIAVTLDAPSDWSDHIKMLDFGFNSLELIDICHKGDYATNLKVLGGNKDTILISAKENLSIIKDKEDFDVIKYIKLPSYIIAPIQKNDVVGQVIYKVGNDEYTIDLIANESSNSTTKYNFIKKLIKRIKNIR